MYTKRPPVHRHDCDHCEYVGGYDSKTGKLYDFYHHGHNMVVVRWGAGNDNMSVHERVHGIQREEMLAIGSLGLR